MTLGAGRGVSTTGKGDLSALCLFLFAQEKKMLLTSCIMSLSLEQIEKTKGGAYFFSLISSSQPLPFLTGISSLDLKTLAG